MVYSPQTKLQRREAWEACCRHCLTFSETRLPVWDLVLAVCISHNMDCRVFALPWLLSSSDGCTKRSGQSWCLPLPEGVPPGSLLCPLRVGVCLFFIHWLLWKHPVVSCALNQMCVLRMPLDRKWGRGHWGKGAGGKLKLEESQTAIAGDR